MPIPSKSPSGRWPIGRQGKRARGQYLPPFGVSQAAVDPTRQTDGHDAKLTATPHARRRRQPGAVLPLGGAVAPVAPMKASDGRILACRETTGSTPVSAAKES